MIIITSSLHKYELLRVNFESYKLFSYSLNPNNIAYRSRQIDTENRKIIVRKWLLNVVNIYKGAGQSLVPTVTRMKYSGQPSIHLPLIIAMFRF